MKRNGFTLIEVLIALVIFAISMATIYWGFSQGFRNSKKAILKLEDLNRINNFYLLNFKKIKNMDEGKEIFSNFEVKKTHINVLINDNFRLEDENFFKIQIKDLNSNSEFTFYEHK